MKRAKDWPDTGMDLKGSPRKSPSPPAEPTGPFVRRVLEIIRSIPRGKILTYGQVAALADAPRAARQVGRILYVYGAPVPWQRVVNHYGGLSTYKVGLGERQRSLLEGEGVVFGAGGTLDLKAYQWRPTFKQIQKLRLPEEAAFGLHTRLPFSSFRTKPIRSVSFPKPCRVRGRTSMGEASGKRKRPYRRKKGSNGKERFR
jgi:methylated-DNA-protein-cysteine methyltransferase-like protein